MIMAAVEGMLKETERHFIRSAEVTTASNGARTVRFSVENIDRVDVSLNGRPCSSLDIDSNSPDPLGDARQA